MNICFTQLPWSFTFNWLWWWYSASKLWLPWKHNIFISGKNSNNFFDMHAIQIYLHNTVMSSFIYSRLFLFFLDIFGIFLEMHCRPIVQFYVCQHLCVLIKKKMCRGVCLAHLLVVKLLLGHHLFAPAIDLDVRHNRRVNSQQTLCTYCMSIRGILL